MGTQTFPSGTVTAFRQTTAPNGWIKLVAFTDFALRIVSGAGGSTSASGSNFSTIHPSGAANQTWPVPSTGYSPSVSDGAVADLPNHAHTVNLGAPNSGLNFTTLGNTVNVPSRGFFAAPADAGLPDGGSQPAGSSGLHTHAVVVAANGSVQLPDWGLKYIDVIVAYKV
jgi:hypothetical protein